MGKEAKGKKNDQQLPLDESLFSVPLEDDVVRRREDGSVIKERRPPSGVPRKKEEKKYWGPVDSSVWRNRKDM